MESSSSSTPTRTTSRPLLLGPCASSGEIELKPKSSKSKKNTNRSPADIELITVSSDNDVEPTNSRETTKKQRPISSEETLDVNPPVSFSASEQRSRMATTSFVTSEMPLYPFSSRHKRRKPWNAVAEADSRKGLRITLKRMMGCGSSLDAMYDDPMPVVVFGATGLIGGAVAKALLRDRRFEVKAVTRSPTTDVARKLAEEGAIIVTANLNDPRSLTRAVEGAHAVFLVTHYWEHMDMDKEITQGKNCVDAAVSAGVSHLVFYGSDSPKEITGGDCAFMDSKAAVEKHVKTTNLSYTALRVPFYYENFLGVFKPHKVRNGVFAIALPMEDRALEMMSVQDVGRCVLHVLLRPKRHLNRVMSLGAERLTVQQITIIFNRHFTDRKFICPRIRVKDYESFGFEGAKDIAAMFEFYQHGAQEVREAKLTRRVQGSPLQFERWVAENRQLLAEVMDAA